MARQRQRRSNTLSRDKSGLRGCFGWWRAAAEPISDLMTHDLVSGRGPGTPRLSSPTEVGQQPAPHTCPFSFNPSHRQDSRAIRPFFSLDWSQRRDFRR
jgi:hypothetical protein